MGKTVWMRVTDDEYELPFMIAENHQELAELCSEDAKIVKVEMEDEDE